MTSPKKKPDIKIPHVEVPVRMGFDHCLCEFDITENRKRIFYNHPKRKAQFRDGKFCFEILCCPEKEFKLLKQLPAIDILTRVDGRNIYKIGTVQITKAYQIVLRELTWSEITDLGRRYGLPIEKIGNNTRNPFRSFLSYRFGGYKDSMNTLLTIIEWGPCVSMAADDEECVYEAVREAAEGSGMHSEPICTVHVDTRQNTLEVYL